MAIPPTFENEGILAIHFMNEQDYNWNLILKISVPVSASIAVVYFIAESRVLKSLFLFGGAVLAGALTYRKDKRKANIFTSAAFVLLAAVVVTAIKRLSAF